MMWIAVALVLAQPAESAWKPHVFRVKNACQGTVLTGFKLAGQTGVLTALHGVVGCPTLTAEAGPLSLTMRLSRADVEHDVGLLEPTEANALPETGLLKGELVAANPLQVIGFPQGLLRPLATRLQLRSPPEVDLAALIPLGDSDAFRVRSSPAMKTKVFSLEGHLTRGHSGAPVFSGANVIAIGNGGLSAGALEISWATPLRGLNLLEVSRPEVALELTRISKRDGIAHEVLFADSTLMDDSAPGPWMCLGEQFDFIRAISTPELVAGAPDPSVVQGIIANYGVTDVPLVFEVFRSARSLTTLVVPRGWSRSGTTTRCSTAPPSQSGVEVTFMRKDVASAQLANQFAIEQENAQFCGQADPFFIDPRMSVIGRATLNRGMLTSRKNFARLDRRCGPPFLAHPMVLGTNLPVGWEQYPQAPPSLSCLPGPNPMCPSPMGLIPSYPEVWWTMQLGTPPALVRGWGFASVVLTRRHSLFSSVILANARVGLDSDRCIARLSEDADCDVVRNRITDWVAAVLAASASTLGGPL